MANSIKFVTGSNPSRWGKKKGACVAHVRHNAIITIDQMVEALTKNSTLGSATARFAVESVCSLIAENIAAGNMLDFNLFSIGLKIGGTFESANAKFDKERNSVSVSFKSSTKLNEIAAALQPMNVTSDEGMVLYEVCCDEAKENNAIIVGARVVVNGSNIAIDTEAEDEGVWLEAKKGDKLYKGTILESDSSSLHCKFTGSIEPGEYQLAVYARDGKDAGQAPSVKRRKVNVMR